jgi:two-component system, OmpR family, phosphate regulon sensor histidine kinase PhoR
MTRKIFSSIMLVAGIVLLASAVIIMGVLYEYFGGIQKTELKTELGLAAEAVENYGVDYLEGLSTKNYRLTWIDSDGTVKYDSVRDAESLENHADRDEVAQALESGEGESTRYSSTLLEKTMYYARRLNDGTVLRISVSRQTAAVLVLGMIQPVLVVLLIALIISGVLAGRLSRKIVEPLNTLDLDHPLENDVYEELSPLLKRINAQHKEITARSEELKQRTDEFSQVTGSMKEALVLLDNRGFILSINSAAKKLFNADDSCVGADFLTIERDHDMSVAIENAAQTGHSELRATRSGREFQFDISRIESDGGAAGTVILAFDVTEQENAERNRREFTANVSHELKTPLQGIIGSAELIENGMVKPEDVPRFVSHIHTEASRLVTLIGDIIRLSQLDEGDEMPMEYVGLLDEANTASGDLASAAQDKNVTVSVDGENVGIVAARRLIYEIIYNLGDNAIKYNKNGGSVKINVADCGAEACVTVADNGIGIAPEHQQRIFERFYRVDKSHSKASGGTGLGLSIVKHAVQYHNGRIELDSKLGSGTTIKVYFPKQIESKTEA